MSSGGRTASGDVVNDFVVSSGWEMRARNSSPFPHAHRAVVGDIVTGRVAVPYTMPRNVSAVSIFLVTRDGLRLTKVSHSAFAREVQRDAAEQGNGVLLNCNLLGISATPCTLFAPPSAYM